MNRVAVVARLTFHEAVRKKLLSIALAGGAAFMVLFGTMLHFQGITFEDHHVPIVLRHQMFSAFEVLGVYAVNFLLVAITVLTSVDTLSGEISSGAIHAIATKPVDRWELFTGKWLGFSGVLTVYALTMLAGICAVSAVFAGSTPRHIITAFSLMWLESMLLLTTTLLFSVSFSTLTAGVIVLGLHGLAFLGGWIEQIAAFSNAPQAVLAGVAASLVMPSESLWRRAAFEMQSPLATALNFSPFSGMSVPSWSMVCYAVAYLCVAFALGVWRLNARDL